MASRLKQLSSSAKVADGPLWLKSIVVTAAADAASVTVDDSADGAGTDLLTVKAAIQTTAAWRTGDEKGVYIGTALYATITGTAPLVTVEWEQG